MTNKEIRDKAWQAITGDGWFGRIVLWCGLLFAIVALSNFASISLFRLLDIQTWEDFNASRQQALMSGLVLAVPSGAAWWRMTCASAFLQCIQYLFAGISAFGIFSVLLKSIRNDRTHLAAAATSGFRNPLPMFWLTALMTIKIAFWSLLFIIPGIIAAINYSLAWFVKADHPELSAFQCIARSCELMDGHRMELISLGLSYCGWYFLIVIILMMWSFISIAGSAAIAMLLFVIALGLTFFASVYALAGQAIFYRELIGEHDNSDRNNGDENNEKLN